MRVYGEHVIPRWRRRSWPPHDRSRDDARAGAHRTGARARARRRGGRRAARRRRRARRPAARRAVGAGQGRRPRRRRPPAAARACCRAPTTSRCRTCGRSWQRVLQPETSAAGSPTVLSAMLAACWFTLRVALAGWLLGVGRRAAARRAHAAVAARRARAPAVGRAEPDRAAHRARAAGGRLGRADPRSAASSGSAGCRWRSSPRYLAFFPVAIGTLRGLQSPPAAQVELLPVPARRAGGARWSRCGCPRACRTCCRRCGSARPTAVVGAIVAEISTGHRGRHRPADHRVRPVRQRRPRQAVGRDHRGRAARAGRRRPRVPARARPGPLPLRGGQMNDASTTTPGDGRRGDRRRQGLLVARPARSPRWTTST